MTTEISKASILEKIEEKNQELALTLNNALKVSLAGWKQILKGKTSTAGKSWALSFLGFDSVILDISPPRTVPTLAAMKHKCP